MIPLQFRLLVSDCLESVLCVLKQFGLRLMLVFIWVDIDGRPGMKCVEILTPSASYLSRQGTLTAKFMF